VSKLGERIAWQLNQVFPTLSIHKELETAKRSVHANQQWAHAEMARVVAGFAPHWDISEKNILDIGTGLGGKLPFYVEAGARTITGIDINQGSLCAAQAHITTLGLDSHQEDRVRLLAADAARLPFPSHCFDAIVSVNVFEQIAKLEEAFYEAHRVLKPGGMAFLHLPPYYSPWGPHLENWIHFPWPHLLFSDQTLLRVAEREDQRRKLNADFVAAARIDWASTGGRIPDVNRVTMRRFSKLVRQAGFEIQQLCLLLVGYEGLATNRNPARRLAFAAIDLAARLPFAGEVLVTKMAYVLRKPHE
jgi:ubiquinone/menaquinone biosynthesis C-methylase UbiE